MVDRRFLHSEYSAYLSRFKRADERTRTAYPCSLRVIIQALQRVAGVCKSRIFRGIFFPWLAPCCTVLRSRWCQSGVKLLVSEHCIQPPASLRSSRSRLASSLWLPAQLSVFRWLVPQGTIIQATADSKLGM